MTAPQQVQLVGRARRAKRLARASSLPPPQPRERVPQMRVESTGAWRRARACRGRQGASSIGVSESDRRELGRGVYHVTV